MGIRPSAMTPWIASARPQVPMGCSPIPMTRSATSRTTLNWVPTPTRLQGSPGRTLTYDYENRPTSITSGGGGGTIDYCFDFRGTAAYVTDPANCSPVF